MAESFLGKASCDEERDRMRGKPFLQLVGSLLDLSTMRLRRALGECWTVRAAVSSAYPPSRATPTGATTETHAQEDPAAEDVDLADLDLKAQSRLQKARTNVDMAGESA